MLVAQWPTALGITVPEDRIEENPVALAVEPLRSTSLRRKRNNGVNIKQKDGGVYFRNVEEDLRLLQFELSMSFASVSPTIQPSKVRYATKWPRVAERKLSASS
jgi:hypothetical protein